MSTVTIAIDAMGGDHGPKVTVPGAVHVLKNHPDLKLILVGKREALEPAIKAAGMENNDRLTIHHASQEVAMDESPAQALRSKKDSSMRVAINLVDENLAQAVVSAGNTGALMATARFVLKTLPGVDRPAIMASLPTMLPNKEVHVLDLGANVDSSAEHLYQFAVMGSVVASAVNNLPQPKVALLNIGEEEIKGNDQVKKTAQLLTDNKAINYIGYIEGDGVFAGIADVVVCDGFVGNVALKTTEGVVRLLTHYLRTSFKRNWLTKLVAIQAKWALKDFIKQIDPGRRNGASLLGLKGIVIKSHGGANALAFAHAIEEAIRQVDKNIPERIHEKVGTVLEDTGSST